MPGRTGAEAARTTEEAAHGVPLVDGDLLAHLLPTGRDRQSKQKRQALFKQWDPNGNRVLSLAEVDDGLEKLVGLGLPKPVINRAFHAARDMAPPLHEWCNDYVDPDEFRLLFVYLRFYLQVWHCFAQMDKVSDRRLTIEEFRDSFPFFVRSTGVAATKVSTAGPEQIFSQMDLNHGGVVLFDEFAHWVLLHGGKRFADAGASCDAEALDLLRQKRPNLCSADDEAHTARKHTTCRALSDYKAVLARSPEHPPLEEAHMGPWTASTRGHPKVLHHAAAGHHEAAAAALEGIQRSLPIGKDMDSKKRRHELFTQWDPNGNGLLSLAEADGGLEKLFGPIIPKPVVNRAFHAARDIAPPIHEWCNDYVDANEFRLFLVYLLHYLELWRWFAEVDSNGDRRLTLHEVKAALPMLQNWGCLTGGDDPAAAFDEMDFNHGGFVLFDEFAHWVLLRGVDCHAKGDRAVWAEALHLLRKKRPNLCSADDVAHEARRHTAAQALRVHHHALRSGSVAKALGADVISLEKLGSALPAGKDHESKARRHSLFIQWDPNCNGLLSLAEVDAGLDKLLGPVIPKPVVNRAFHAARDISPPIHEWCDDYVDANEFRLFLVYVQHYFELWQWFVQFDANHDRRLTVEEMIAASDLLREMTHRGDFENGAENMDPEKTFHEMDLNHGGFVLFDEFAHWALHRGVGVQARGEEWAEALKKLKQKRPNLCAAGDHDHEARRHIVAQGMHAQRRALRAAFSHHHADAPEDGVVEAAQQATPQSAPRPRPAPSTAASTHDAAAVLPCASHSFVSQLRSKHSAANESGPPAVDELAQPVVAHAPDVAKVASRRLPSPASRLCAGPSAADDSMDWGRLAEMLPTGTSKNSKQRRHALFSHWDPNGNGVLSLAEVDAGLAQVLGPWIPKPVIARAFHAARDIAPPVHAYSSDYIDASEFRCLLVYIWYYLHLWQWFSEMDTSHDRRLSLQEFIVALPKLASWGFRTPSDISVPDATIIFDEIDEDHGGFILFDEFAHWALMQGAGGLDDSDSNEKAETLKLLQRKTPNKCPSYTTRRPSSLSAASVENFHEAAGPQNAAALAASSVSRPPSSGPLASPCNLASRDDSCTSSTRGSSTHSPVGSQASTYVGMVASSRASRPNLPPTLPPLTAPPAAAPPALFSQCECACDKCAQCRKRREKATLQHAIERASMNFGQGAAPPPADPADPAPVSLSYSRGAEGVRAGPDRARAASAPAQRPRSAEQAVWCAESGEVLQQTFPEPTRARGGGARAGPSRGGSPACRAVSAARHMAASGEGVGGSGADARTYVAGGRPRRCEASAGAHFRRRTAATNARVLGSAASVPAPAGARARFPVRVPQRGGA